MKYVPKNPVITDPCEISMGQYQYKRQYSFTIYTHRTSYCLPEVEWKVSSVISRETNKCFGCNRIMHSNIPIALKLAEFGKLSKKV